MTQADLATKIQVTDKAVSRWEREIGFPDINTLEPLANALEISVLELMKSERITTNQVTDEEAGGAGAEPPQNLPITAAPAHTDESGL